MRRKTLGAALATAAVAVGLTVPASSGAAPLPDNCVKEQSEIRCTSTTTQGAPHSSSQKTTTTETKGSFSSSHPETSCRMPPPSGKCSTTG
jgi:hypothetical protein